MLGQAGAGLWRVLSGQDISSYGKMAGSSQSGVCWGHPSGEPCLWARVSSECFLEELSLKWALNDQKTLHQQRFGSGAAPGVLERSSELGENETGELNEVSSERASGAWLRLWALLRSTDPSSIVWEAEHLRKLKVLS